MRKSRDWDHVGTWTDNVIGPWSAAGATNSDFALFDGTNPNNRPGSGAVCGTAAGGPQTPVFFTYHVNVSNWSDSLAVLRITFTDGDITRYQIPARSSFSLTEEGGSKRKITVAIRASN